MVAARTPGWALLVWLAGCAGGSSAPSAPPPVTVTADVPRDTQPPSAALPPVPEARGPLALRVVYPPPNALVRAADSTFLFGSTGTGRATLTVNGEPVRVWPNGGWLAWVPLPPDSVMRFRLEARTDSAATTLEHAVRRAGWRPPPPPASVWIDATTLVPRGRLWWPRDEYLALSLRATEGAEVRLALPDGTIIPLRPEGGERFAGVLRGRAVGPDPGPLFPPVGPPIVASSPVASDVRFAPDSLPSDSVWAVAEAIIGFDTVRTRWPLQLALLDTLPLVAEMDDDSLLLGTTDSISVGRALPEGTYHWFLPTGTRAPVSGRANADLRLRLSPSAQAWVAVGDARRAPEDVVTPAVVGSVTLVPRADRVTARIPLTRRVPFRVTEEDRALVLRLHGAVGDVNWIRYGATDSLVRRVAWDQPAEQEVTLTFHLERPVWGYRARWDGGDLLFEIRRPPALDGRDPLRGRLIAVDAGHPPAGATGPTGLREAEANLGVALELRRMLEAAGAKVLMTRTEDVPIELWPRVEFAEQSGAELLISVHNNALPDGINPFTNSGTSVYYNQPRSIPLARAIQRELVRRLGIRDLGIGRGDLALVRATWLPSVLTEGLFMMLPEQEAALRSEHGRRLYAQAILEGIRRYLDGM